MLKDYRTALEDMCHVCKISANSRTMHTIPFLSSQTKMLLEKMETRDNADEATLQDVKVLLIGIDKSLTL